jgi:spermidine synthase
MLQKLFSYLLPLNIFQQKSEISHSLEITWANGQLVLDSKNTNYSYGSLQRILRMGLKRIGFKTIKSMSDILVLGVAGGSVIKTLVDEIDFKGKITGVEIDPKIIEIANQYFKLNEITNLEIVIDDAFEFVLKTKSTYDLIIIDVFQDTLMPNFLFETFFTNRIGMLLNSKGFLLFNTMCLSNEHEIRNEKYSANFPEKQFSIQKMKRIEQHNEIFIIQKLA